MKNFETEIGNQITSIENALKPKTDIDCAIKYGTFAIQSTFNMSQYTVKSCENKRDDLATHIEIEIITKRNIRKY